MLPKRSFSAVPRRPVHVNAGGLHSLGKLVVSLSHIGATLLLVANTRFSIQAFSVGEAAMPFPLSGTDVVAHLAYRAIGSGPYLSVVLDYFGLAGRRAAKVSDIAQRHAVTDRAIRHHVAKVRRLAGLVVISDELAADIVRDSLPREDHRRRVRSADTLGLRRPSPSATSDQSVATALGQS